MKRYLLYWVRLAKVAASGTIQGSLNWAPIIGAAIFGAALSIGHQTKMPQLLTDGWLGVVLSAVAFSVITWVFFFLVRLGFVAPYALLKEAEDRLSGMEDLLRKNIHVSWRFTSEKFVELILINPGLKSIPGVEVSFRNYRDALGSRITDVICSMNSVEGKGPRIQMDPVIQYFFRFARVSKEDNGRSFVEFTPTGRDPIRIDDTEVGAKFTIGGDDIPASTVHFRLKLNDDDSLTIEPWEHDGKAVNPGGA